MRSERPAIPVLFTCDANYLQHAAACVASLLQNTRDCRFDIHVANSHPFGAAADKFRRSFAGSDRVAITLHEFAIPERDRFPLRIHYTLETYLRLWIAEILPQHKRALFLDPDMVTTRSVRELWDFDLGGHTIAAVPIPGSTRPPLLGLREGSLYFSSGVILFDLEKWRGKNYLGKCLDFIQKFPEKLVDADQDALNACLVGDWTALPYEWNVISPFYFEMHDLKLPREEIERVRREVGIVHFNGRSKPWHYMCRHPRKPDYWRYLAATEWKDAKEDDRTLGNVLKKRVVPNFVKEFAHRLQGRGTA